MCVTSHAGRERPIRWNRGDDILPRNYQITKNNPYLLPHNLYMRVLYIIRDYDRMKDEYQEILQLSPPALTGVPGSRELTDPTGDKAIRLAMISGEMHAVDQALMDIPREYRQGLMRNIKYGDNYPNTAHYNTWRYNKYKFCYKVAKRLKLS